MICCWPEEFLDRVTTRYVSIWFDSWCMIMNPVSGSSLMYKIFCFPSTSAKEAFYYARFDKHFKCVLSGQYNNEHFTNNENLKITFTISGHSDDLEFYRMLWWRVWTQRLEHKTCRPTFLGVSKTNSKHETTFTSTLYIINTKSIHFWSVNFHVFVNFKPDFNFV